LAIPRIAAPPGAPDRETLDVAADVARVGLWHWDLASGVMYIDSRSAFAHGVPIEHPAEDFIARVIHQDDAASFRTALTQALSSPHLTSHQLRVVDRDGHSRAVEIRMRVIRDMKAQAQPECQGAVLRRYFSARVG